MARQQQQENLTESASRLGRFAGSTQTQQGKSDPIKNIQEFAKAENERKRKEEEEKKKKAAQVSTAPAQEEGFLSRMYKKYVSPYMGGSQ